MALKYWGKIISDYSAMRWPCDEWWHIPLKEEWSAVHDIWRALGWWANDWTNFWATLKMPFTGYRANLTSNVTGQNSYGHYWSSTAHTSNSQAYSFILYPGTIYRASTNVRCYWESIRPFKDEPVIPDSNWTTLYTSDIYPAVRNIKWNSSLWLITITYEWTYITIADKNLWATQVRNSWDTLSEANCGKYYQRWNNYWFAWTWTLANTSTTQVDASTYWPWNYYSSNTFIKYSWARDSSDNRNLRWWVTWVKQKPVDIVEKYYWGKLIADYSAMRWPCPSGYHIATLSEWQSLMWTWSHLWAWNINWRWDDVKLYLRIPFAWIRFPQNWGTTYNGTNWQWYSANLWTSTGPSTSDDTARSFQITASSVRLDAISVRSAGYSVRPFKDVPVAPDSSWTTLYDWSSVAIWAWVFHNSTLWLISISWDWTTWTTIADKNLWATIIYSNWDTLSQANCGNFYQWWNCYWFPFSWNVTTSWTQVDASTYWPRNYYTSSTFITRNSGSSDWSSVKNDNLWWWVTWIQQRIAEVKEVYHNTTKIWPGVISYDIDDIKSWTAILPSETVKKMVIDFSTVNPWWTVFQMNWTSNYMYITSTTSFVINIGIDGFSTLADLSSYGLSSPSETSGTVELDFASDTYNINITSIINWVSAPYSDSWIMNSNGPFAITDRVWQDFGWVSTWTVSLVV